jgi:hypothetical protein
MRKGMHDVWRARSAVMSATSRCTPSKMSDWFVSSNEATRRSIWRASSCERVGARAPW